jgi:hypothetical protein
MDLISAENTHDFLKENKYISYELQEIEELLIKAGIIDMKDIRKTSK